MIYKLSNKNEKEWNGKKFVEAELTDTNGETFKVSAWAGEFNDKDTWEGELVKNDKGYWKLVSKKAVAGANFKQEQIKETMDIKAKSIGKFQDNKEWSIKVSSTMRDAVSLAIAEIKDIRTLNTLEQDILKWREWLWKNWDVDPKDYPPFE